MPSALQRMSAMTPEDKDFYAELGLRIAQARKAQNITQQQMAAMLGISQQTVAHYEVGRLRISVYTLRHLAEVLNFTLDEMVNGTGNLVAKEKSRRGPDSKLQLQMDKVRQLPRTKQQFVMEMLDTVIQQSAT